jgi:hypothetical protein
MDKMNLDSKDDDKEKRKGMDVCYEKFHEIDTNSAITIYYKFMKTDKENQVNLFENYLRDEVHARMTLTDENVHHNSEYGNGIIASAYICTTLSGTSVCCRQYLMSGNDDERFSCLVDLKGTDDTELVTAADCIDQIIETYARTHTGFIRRYVGCNTCNNGSKTMPITKTNLSEIQFCEYDGDRLKETRCSIGHNAAQMTIRLLSKLKEEGNFVNFNEYIVENEEQIILGTMKIRTKNSEERLHIRARLVRKVDLRPIADHVKKKGMVSTNLMVYLKKNIIFNFSGPDKSSHAN